MPLVELLAGSPGLLVGAVFLLGLLVGSFLNVVVHRVPIMLDREWRAQCAELAGREPAKAEPYNLVAPRSACPSCKAPITAAQNVPVVSWLLLRGQGDARGLLSLEQIRWRFKRWQMRKRLRAVQNDQSRNSNDRPYFH